MAGTPQKISSLWLFRIDIERCARRGGRLQVIASIEDREVIARILAHRRQQKGPLSVLFARGTATATL